MRGGENAGDVKGFPGFCQAVLRRATAAVGETSRGAGEEISDAAGEKTGRAVRETTGGGAGEITGRAVGENTGRAVGENTGHAAGENTGYSEIRLGRRWRCYMLRLYVSPGLTPMKMIRGSANLRTRSCPPRH